MVLCRTIFWGLLCLVSISIFIICLSSAEVHRFLELFQNFLHLQIVQRLPGPTIAYTRARACARYYNVRRCHQPSLTAAYKGTAMISQYFIAIAIARCRCDQLVKNRNVVIPLRPSCAVLQRHLQGVPPFCLVLLVCAVPSKLLARAAPKTDLKSSILG